MRIPLSPPLSDKILAVLILTLYSIFLYLFITGIFGGTLVFVYKTWIEALFPKSKRPKVVKKTKKVDIVEPLSGNESAGAGTGTDEFDASWIPSHHINRPVAKRVKSGAKGKSKTSAVVSE